MPKIFNNATQSSNNCQRIMKLYIFVVFSLMIINTLFNKNAQTFKIILYNVMSLIFCCIIFIITCDTIPTFTYLMILILILGTIISLYNNIGCQNA